MDYAQLSLSVTRCFVLSFCRLSKGWPIRRLKMRERIFVSYSHKDAAWRNRLRDAVSGGIYAQIFDVWSDEQIVPGKR
jgi:hypothetical protein